MKKVNFIGLCVFVKVHGFIYSFITSSYVVVYDISLRKLSSSTDETSSDPVADAEGVMKYTV